MIAPTTPASTKAIILFVVFGSAALAAGLVIYAIRSLRRGFTLDQSGLRIEGKEARDLSIGRLIFGTLILGAVMLSLYGTLFWI